MFARLGAMFVRSLLLLALVSTGCSRAEANHEPGATTTAPLATSATAKAFGDRCVDDAECSGGICFHKRLKGIDAGPEKRGEIHAELEEREGYCSMRCTSDSDCPVPLTRGKCGARGMCKRPE